MAQDKLQSERYEFKYIVDDAKADTIREYILTYLKPDKFTAGREGLGYAVHSLYLDSSDLATVWAVIQGAKNRFKLRVRFYDNTGPVFFEIKRRVNLVILKQRAMVQRKYALELLEGAPLNRKYLVDPENAKHFKALYNFCELRDQLQARPAAYTSYMREGYERLGDNSVRVTFDRQLRAGKFNGSLDISDLDHWTQPEMGGVVLELKFTNQFPEWMHTLVQWMHLTRTGFAKYVKCAAEVHGLTHFGK